MKKNLSLISIVIAFAVAFSGMSYVPVYGAAKVPGKVTALKYTAKSTTSVKLRWKKVPKAAGYHVYRFDAGKWKKAATLKGAKKTTYTNKKLKPGKIYKFRVRAYRGKKCGKWSATIRVKTRSKASQKGSREKTVKRTVTDFMGVTRTFCSDDGGVDGSWYLEGDTDPYRTYESPDLILYNREINGSMKTDDFGGQTLYQQSGGFFGVNTYGSWPLIYIYKGDPSKLSFEPVKEFSSVTVNTYNYDKQPIVKKYLVKDGCRIVSYSIYDSELSDYEKNYYKQRFGMTGIKQKTLYTSGSSAGCGYGYQRTNVLDLGMDTEFIMKYNGAAVCKIFCKNVDKDAVKDRQELLDVAIAGIKAAGGKKSYSEDMANLIGYISVNYPYEKYTCAGGASILEAYSIYAYNVYGFFSYGNQGPNGPNNNYGAHVSFNLDSDPEQYYEAQGHH